MKSPVRVGIVGLGFMGSTHFRIYQSHPLAKITAIADIDPAKRRGDLRAVSGNIGGGDNSVPLDLEGIEVYGDALELIRSPEVDLVDLCVPVGLHHPYALAAIAAGKAVFCEKPLARTAAQAAEIAAAVREAQTPFFTGMCVRYWPEYADALRRVRAGETGSVRCVTLKRVSPSVAGSGWNDWFMQEDLSGGALLDLHLHDVDFIRQLLGMPHSVTAFGVRGVRSDRGVDHVLARYDYGDGALVTAEGGWSPAKGSPFEMSFLIVGERQTLRLGVDGYQVIHETGEIETPDVAHPAGPTGWHVEIDHLLRALLENRSVEMNPEELVQAIAMVEAEARSIDTAQTITLNTRKI